MSGLEVLPTLARSGAPLASPERQRELLEAVELGGRGGFGEHLAGAGLDPLRARGVEVLQVNVGRVCNQTCRHCHVDAGPDRDEDMTRETAELCMRALAATGIPTVDITGGAPELNANFEYLVRESRRLGRHVIDRCNLTILSARALEHEYAPAELREAAERIRCAPVSEEPIKRGPRAGERKLVALTFEDGPSLYTPQILDVLGAGDHVATFFVSGEQIATRERLIQRMLVEGSEIASHGLADRDVEPAPSTSLAHDLEAAKRLIGEAVPFEPCLVRAPALAANDDARAAAQAVELQPVLSSLDGKDGETESPEEIAERVLSHVKPGAIVRLRDGGGARWPTVQALPLILAGLERRGFETVTVSEMLAGAKRGER